MRILGIDCGTQRTGYGVIDSDGRDHRMVTAGVIKTSASHSLADRLKEISRRLRHVIAEFTPEAAAVEEVFLAKNAQSALKLAHVRGIALLAVAEADLPCAEYSALEVKTSVVGYGRAEKSQVQTMIHSLLRPAESIASEDACDALAVAICHATHAKMGR